MLGHPEVGGKHGDQKGGEAPGGRTARGGDQHTEPTGELSQAGDPDQSAMVWKVVGNDREKEFW